MNRFLHYIGPAKAGPRQARDALSLPKGGHHVRNVGALAAAAALLGGVVYVNALRNPFVYDDHHTVVENPSIADVTNARAIVLGAVTRPIVNFSYALDRAIWGAGPLGFHVTNVLLHMLTVMLLFQLAWRFGKDGIASFAAAALLAVHPMMTEAVGYISGRSEVLCAAFFILALMCGRRWIQADGAKWAALTVGLWVAALATKESAAMFPFVFLAYDWLGAAGTSAERRRRMLTIHLPLIAAAVVAGIARLVIFARIEYPGQVSIHWDYLLLELDVIRRYVWMIVNPSGQALFHEVAPVGIFEFRALVAFLVVGSMAALAWRLRRADWVASLGLVWFFLALVPSTVLIALDQGEPMSEHRVYLASCGLFLSIGSGIGWIAQWINGPAKAGPHVRSRFLAASAFGLVLLSLAALTIVRNAVWADPVRLWGESVDMAPTHYRPRLLLGEALQDAGRRDDALEQYRTAIRLRPNDPSGYVKAGQILAETAQWGEARRHFLKALEVDPGNVSASRSLTLLDEIESRLGITADRR